MASSNSSNNDVPSGMRVHMITEQPVRYRINTIKVRSAINLDYDWSDEHARWRIRSRLVEVCTVNGKLVKRDFDRASARKLIADAMSDEEEEPHQLLVDATPKLVEYQEKVASKIYKRKEYSYEELAALEAAIIKNEIDKRAIEDINAYLVVSEEMNKIGLQSGSELKDEFKRRLKSCLNQHESDDSLRDIVALINSDDDARSLQRIFQCIEFCIIEASNITRNTTLARLKTCHDKLTPLVVERLAAVRLASLGCDIDVQSGNDDYEEMSSYDQISIEGLMRDTEIKSPVSSGSYGFSTASETSDDMSEGQLRNLYETLKQAILDGAMHCKKLDLSIISKIEPVLWFICFDWPKAKTKMARIAVVTRLLTSLVGIDKIVKACDWLVNMFEREVEPQMGFEGVKLETFHLFDISSQFLGSELYHKLTKFICALMALAVATGARLKIEGSIFEGLWNMSKVAIQQSDIISTVLGFLSWLLTSGFSILSGETSFHDFFTKPSDMQLFDTRVAKLDYYKNEIEAGRQDEVTFAAYGIEIRALMGFAQKLSRVANKQTRLTLANQIRKIDMHWTWYKTKEASEPLRRAPFAVLIIGQTSVAKSCIMPYLSIMFQKALGLDVGPEHVYDYNPSEAYMTGFSNNINIIQLDDAGNTQVAFADKQVSSVVIDLINNNKRVAVMADLDSKGQYLIKPDVVLTTTNEPQIHAGVTSVSAISILRRYKVHMLVRVKKEFATPGGMLREGINPDLHRMDVWEIDLYQWEPVEGEPTKMVQTNWRRDLSFPEVCRILIAEARAHKAIQQNIVDVTSNLKNVEMCPCGLFDYMCTECNPADPRMRPQCGCDPSIEWAHINEFVRVKCYNKWVSHYNKSLTFIRLMASIQVLTNEYRGRNWVLMMYFAVGQLLSILVVYVCMPVVTLGFLSATFLNVCAMFAMATYKFLRVFRLPLYEGVQQAIISLRTDTKRIAKNLAGVILVVAIMRGAYALWKSNISPQGGFASKIEGVSNHKNVYTEQFVKPMPINCDASTSTADQIVQCIKPRMFMGRFLETRNVAQQATTASLLPICSECVLAPYHILCTNKYKYLQIFFASSNVNNASKIISIEGAWKRIGDSDLCIIKTPSIGDQKDIRKWFPRGSIVGDGKEKLSVNSTGCQLIWLRGTRLSSMTEPLVFNVTRGIARVNASSSLVLDMKNSLGIEYWGGKYFSPIPTFQGMCGSVLITDRSSGPYILGIHSAGAEGTGTARYCSIAQDDIDNTIDSFSGDIVPQSIMHESGDFVSALNFVGTQFLYTDKQGPRATSPYIKGEYEVLGHNTCQQRTFRSNVKISMWSEELSMLGYPRVHEAPQYINHYTPWNVWFTNVAAPSLIETPYLQRARDDYALHLVKSIDEHPEWNFPEEVKVLPHEVVLAGIDGKRGIDAINKKTSMGIPYCKPKSDYIQPVDRTYPGITQVVDIPDHLKKEIDKMEKALAAGQRVYVPHRCNLKDEAVKINKAKVRVFMGSPFAYLYLMRKYFLSLSAFMQEHPDIFEMAVGVNAYSREWTNLRDYLTKYSSKNMVAGDYKAYDQKMEIALTKAAFEILIMLCEIAGYTDRQLTILRGLMTETIAGCYDVKGEWIGLTSANPSGHSLTVVINGIANCIQVRASYFKLGGIKPFASLVSLMTYGDDNIMGVSDEIPWFNHTAIAAVMAEWGITYTMADKEAESLPYIDISQCTFLKRKWVWCDRRRIFLAPVEMDSIMKTLHTYVASKSIDIKEQHAQLLLSANREIYLHGDALFAEMSPILLSMAQSYDILHFLPSMKLESPAALDVWLGVV